MQRWPFPLVKTTREEIQKYCVEDLTWQSFRLRLMGLPTVRKLDRLYEWRDLALISQPNIQRCDIQISNYLNALKRGGYLDSKLRVAK